MEALRTILTSTSSTIQLQIPKEMQNRDLEVIILPLSNRKEGGFDFWTSNELNQIRDGANLASLIPDNEDYSTW